MTSSEPISNPPHAVGAGHTTEASNATPFPPAADGQPGRVLLIDASAVLVRCYHGYPPQPSAHGTPPRVMDVAALYGYLEYIRILEKHLEAERCVHVLDSTGSAARMMLYPGYKAHRPPPEPALAAQDAALPRLLAALGLRHLVCRGVEADDLLATLARSYARRGAMVGVVSPDKDMLQLVDDGHIVVLRYERLPPDQGGGKAHVQYEARDVRSLLGVDPAQVVDYLSLVGDEADNIPGVHGVGAQKAATLLQHCGTLSGVFQDAERLAQGKGPAAAAARCILKPGAAAAARLGTDLVRLLDTVPSALTEPDAPDPAPHPAHALAWMVALGIDASHPLAPLFPATGVGVAPPAHDFRRRGF